MDPDWSLQVERGKDVRGSMQDERGWGEETGDGDSSLEGDLWMDDRDVIVRRRRIASSSRHGCLVSELAIRN